MNAADDPTAAVIDATFGFWSFKSLAAAIELGIFDHLETVGAATLNEIADALDLGRRGTDMLLACCAGMGLLEKTDTRFSNTALASQSLVTTSPGYFGAFITYLDRKEYIAWHRICDALRSDRPVTWDPNTQADIFKSSDEQMLDLFWRGMHSGSSATAALLATAHDFSRHRRLLDVGGGSGAYAIQVCALHQHLQAAVLDLPHVLPLTATYIADAGLTDRIETISGDFSAALPTGYDVVLLCNVLHDWGPEENRVLLRNCYDALPSGGVLLVAELLLDEEHTGPLQAALMGLAMVADTRTGRNYSAGELCALMREAGFEMRSPVRISTPAANCVLVAAKP